MGDWSVSVEHYFVNEDESTLSGCYVMERTDGFFGNHGDAYPLCFYRSKSEGVVYDLALVGGEGRIVLRGNFLEVLAVVRYFHGDFAGVQSFVRTLVFTESEEISLGWPRSRVATIGVELNPIQEPSLNASRPKRPSTRVWGPSAV